MFHRYSKAVAIAALTGVILGCMLMAARAEIVPDVMWVRMNESSWNGTSGEVIDSSSNGYNGTAVGGANTTADGIEGRGGLVGNYGATYLDFVDTPTYQQFSVEIWVKGLATSSGNPNGHLVTKAGYSGSREWVLSQNASSLYFNIGGSNYTAPGVIVPTDDNWHQVVGTYNGSVIALYLDGQLKGTTDWMGTVPDTSETVKVGRWGAYNEGPASVNVDELGIYSYALSAEQVAARYNALTIPEPASLTLLFVGAIALVAYAWRRRR